MDVNELAIKCKSDKRYITELWQSVYRLIARWALLYVKSDTSRYDIDDLTQSAYFALVKAIDDYPYDCEYKFTTYLSYHCRREFRTVLGIRTSKREPVTISLDAAAHKDCTTTIGETIPDAKAAAAYDKVIDGVYFEQFKNALNKAMAVLTDKQRKLIDMRFYKSMRTTDIAALLGLANTNSVARLEREALQALRRGKAYSMLKGFDYRSAGLKRNSLSYFRYNWESSVEAAVLKKLEFDGLEE